MIKKRKIRETSSNGLEVGGGGLEREGTLGSDVTLNLVGVFIIV